MSNSFIKDCTDASSSGNKTFIIFVKDDSTNIPIEGQQFQNMLVNHGADPSNVSVLQMAPTDNSLIPIDQSIAADHGTYLSDQFPSEMAGVDDANYTLSIDDDTIQRLESVLHTDEAKEILGDSLLDFVANPALVPIEPTSENTHLEKSKEEDISEKPTGKKGKSPKRRSQRQMDKAEREEVEKILAENHLMFKREREELRKLQEAKESAENVEEAQEEKEVEIKTQDVKVQVKKTRVEKEVEIKTLDVKVQAKKARGEKDIEIKTPDVKVQAKKKKTRVEKEVEIKTLDVKVQAKKTRGEKDVEIKTPDVKVQAKKVRGRPKKNSPVVTKLKVKNEPKIEKNKGIEMDRLKGVLKEVSVNLEKLDLKQQNPDEFAGFTLEECESPKDKLKKSVDTPEKDGHKILVLKSETKLENGEAKSSLKVESQNVSGKIISKLKRLTSTEDGEDDKNKNEDCDIYKDNNDLNKEENKIFIENKKVADKDKSYEAVTDPLLIDNLITKDEIDDDMTDSLLVSVKPVTKDKIDVTDPLLLSVMTTSKDKIDMTDPLPVPDKPSTEEIPKVEDIMLSNKADDANLIIENEKLHIKKVNEKSKSSIKSKFSKLNEVKEEKKIRPDGPKISRYLMNYKIPKTPLKPDNANGNAPHSSQKPSAPIAYTTAAAKKADQMQNEHKQTKPPDNLPDHIVQPKSNSQKEERKFPPYRPVITKKPKPSFETALNSEPAIVSPKTSFCAKIPKIPKIQSGTEKDNPKLERQHSAPSKINYIKTIKVHKKLSTQGKPHPASTINKEITTPRFKSLSESSANGKDSTQLPKDQPKLSPSMEAPKSLLKKEIQKYPTAKAQPKLPPSMEAPKSPVKKEIQKHPTPIADKPKLVFQKKDTLKIHPYKSLLKLPPIKENSKTLHNEPIKSSNVKKELIKAQSKYQELKPTGNSSADIKKSKRLPKKKLLGDDFITSDEDVSNEEDSEQEDDSDDESIISDEGISEQEEEYTYDNDDPKKLWCICQQPHNHRFMICCDKCEEWFHGSCVGITKAMGRQMEMEEKEWNCPRCMPPEKSVSSTKKEKKLKKWSDDPNTNNQDPSTARVLVYEKRTGVVLSGTAAPTLNVLTKWLRKNFRYTPLLPEMMSKVVTDPVTGAKSIPINNDSDDEPVTRTPKSNHSKSSDDTPVYKKVTKVEKGSDGGVVIKDSYEHDPEYFYTAPKVKTPKKTILIDNPQTSHIHQRIKEKKEKKLKERMEKLMRKEKEKEERKREKLENRKEKEETRYKEKNIVREIPKTPKEDAKQTIRTNVKKMLFDALSARKNEAVHEFKDMTDQFIKDLCEKIELELYLTFSKDIGFKYKSRYRSLVFNIKDAKNGGLYRKILSGGVEPNKLAKMTSDELASKELIEWRQQTEKKELEAIQKHELEMIELGNQYIMKSHKGEIAIDKDDFIKSKESAAPETVNKLPEETVQENEDEINHRNHIYDPTCPICMKIDLHTKTKEKKQKKTKEKKDKRDRSRHRSPSRKWKQERSTSNFSDREEYVKYKEKLKSMDKHSRNSRDIDRDESTDIDRYKSRDRDRHGSRDRDRYGSRDKERPREKESHKSRDKDRHKSRERHKHKKHHKERKRKRHSSSSDERNKKEENDEAKPAQVAQVVSTSDDVVFLPTTETPTSSVDAEPTSTMAEIPIASEITEDHEEFLLPQSPATPPIPCINVDISDTEACTPPQSPRTPLQSPRTPPMSSGTPPLSPSTPPLPELNALSQKQPQPIWKGSINMQDVATFGAAAFEVSGKANYFEEDVPASVDIVGRINQDNVWNYITQMKKNTSREILVIRFQPSNEDEKVAYIALYIYLSSKKRYGVIGNCEKSVKDFYIIPLASTQPIPQVLLPLDGPGFDDERPHMLIGVVVRAKHRRVYDPKGSVWIDVGGPPPQKLEVSKRPTPLPMIVPETNRDSPTVTIEDSPSTDFEVSYTPQNSPSFKENASLKSPIPVEAASEVKPPEENKAVVEELDRQIKKDKEEVSDMQKEFDKGVQNEPGSVGQLDTSQINLPSNLQDILANIKVKEMEIQDKEIELKRRLNMPGSDSSIEEVSSEAHFASSKDVDLRVFSQPLVTSTPLNDSSDVDLRVPQSVFLSKMSDDDLLAKAAEMEGASQSRTQAVNLDPRVQMEAPPPNFKPGFVLPPPFQTPDSFGLPTQFGTTNKMDDQRFMADDRHFQPNMPENPFIQNPRFPPDNRAEGPQRFLPDHGPDRSHQIPSEFNPNGPNRIPHVHLPERPQNFPHDYKHDGPHRFPPDQGPGGPHFRPHLPDQEPRGPHFRTHLPTPPDRPIYDSPIERIPHYSNFPNDDHISGNDFHRDGRPPNSRFENSPRGRGFPHSPYTGRSPGNFGPRPYRPRHDFHRGSPRQFRDDDWNNRKRRQDFSNYENHNKRRY